MAAVPAPEDFRIGHAQNRRTIAGPADLTNERREEAAPAQGAVLAATASISTSVSARPSAATCTVVRVGRLG